MQKGDKVLTPRFSLVNIEEVFEDKQSAIKAGFKEPTYYNDSVYGILGKHIGLNQMVFAGYKK